MGLLLACNPFSPGLDDALTDPERILGNRRTLDGFFEWFRNSYQLRDSTMYGKILNPDFTFTYRNFSNSTEESWDRNTEVRTTYNLFRNVQGVNLQWNQYLFVDTTSFDTLASVERSFNLIITQDDNNVFRGIGSALLVLNRDAKGQPWRMKSWYDKSDF